MISIKSKAPDFTLPDKDGKPVSLADFKGKKVILYFYPKDDTPGCTKQACGFAELLPQFSEEAAVVIGISKDSEESHQKFAEKYNLPFILLSDPDLQAIKLYDVWQEKKMYGKSTMGVERTTYIIDENGIIISADNKVKAETNAQDVLTWIKNPVIL